MNRSGNIARVAFLALVLLVATAPAAPAAYLYDWTQPGVQTVGDASGDTGRGSRDILSASQAFDGTYTYFRIDLRSTPSSSDWNFAEIYGIYIDHIDGGAPASNYYVPEIPGIGAYGNRIDSILLTWFSDFRDNEGLYKKWGNGWFSYTTSDGVLFQHSQNSGTTLEWRFEGDFGTDYTWYAATMQPNYQGNKKTFDYVAGSYSAVPIPSAAWLFGSGIIGFVLLKRRKAGSGTTADNR